MSISSIFQILIIFLILQEPYIHTREDSNFNCLLVEDGALTDESSNLEFRGISGNPEKF